jgi:hypothetical protein
MQYMCLVYFDQTSFAGKSDAELKALTDETIAEDHALRAAGRLIVARPLDEPRTAVNVKVRDGRMQRTDGPYVETKEWLGGFLLINASDMADAVAVAEKLAIARVGRVEVRAIVDQTHSETGQGRPEAKL